MDMRARVRLPDDWQQRVRDALGDSPCPELARGSLRVLGAGMDSVALQLDSIEGRYVLRLPRDPHGAEGIAREVGLLPELAARLPLPIPQFLFTAPNPLGPGEFCVYPLVAGESLEEQAWVARGVPARPDSACIVAEVIEGIHSYPVDRAREFGVEPADLRTEFTAALNEARTLVFPLLEPSEAAILAQMWEGYLERDANFEYEPTLVHADLSVDHLLVDGDRICGLIDFGDVEISDPGYDLCYLYPEVGAEFVRAVQHCRARELDSALEDKLRFWACADPALELLEPIDGDEPQPRRESLRDLRAALHRHYPRSAG